MPKRMSKNYLRVLLSTLLICSIIMGISYVVAPKVQAADEQKTFTVGFDAEFPPYGYKDSSGEYVGFDLDLAEEVCKRNGWELVKQPIDWDSKDMELNSGSIDCIWNGFTMDGRENAYTWSTPYVDNSQVVIVKSDSNINKLSDLKDKIVVVQADSSALAAFTGEDATDENKALAESFKELQQVGDYNSAFLNLESDMVQAICMDIGVANYQIKTRDGNFRMLDEHVSSEKYGIGFKKGNTELRNAVQETLLAMKDDGKFNEIAKKWGLETSVCLSAEDKFIDDIQNSGTASEGETSYVFNKLNFVDVLGQLLNGMQATLLIFALTLVFSLPLGLLITFARMSRFKIVQWLAQIYISIMRGTPLMLQLLVVCYGPYYIFNISLDQSYRTYAVIIGFSINYAAYFAEIFRAGIQSVPHGQRESAAILGYSRPQTFGKIIFPQMAKHILPPVTNEIITLVKDTSLAFALAYTEVFTLAKQIAATQASIMPLFVAGLFYYVFNIVVAFVMERIEKRLNYYH
ncbi:MAG: ABC transporter permease subunit [Ruminococcus sp.]|nr:ABC transporter permease subunit [Ruminococcus sp.]